GMRTVGISYSLASAIGAWGSLAANGPYDPYARCHGKARARDQDHWPGYCAFASAMGEAPGSIFIFMGVEKITLRSSCPSTSPDPTRVFGLIHADSVEHILAAATLIDKAARTTRVRLVSTFLWRLPFVVCHRTIRPCSVILVSRLLGLLSRIGHR